jgi:aspartate/methionine/tyrosine aminotransferase
MHFESVMDSIEGIQPDKALTYAPSFGVPELRQTWKDEIVEKNPSCKGKPISLPIVTCGITHGISTFADVWVDPDDVIILPDMMWGNYNMVLTVRKHARISQYSLFVEKGGFNLAAFEEKVREEAEVNDKIIVLLNFPQNPTGYTITKEEAVFIANLLGDIAEGGTNVVAVLDDAYFGLFYEEETIKESLFANLCDRHPRLLAIKLDGATKENFVWGLRLGFITYGCKMIGDPALVYDAVERKTAGDIRGTISNASHLTQSIVLKSMQDDRYLAEKEDKFSVLKNRAVQIKEVLRNPKYDNAWELYPFNSGYFMCIKLISQDAETLRKHLLDTYGVGLIALGKRNLRVAFSCIEEDEVQELFDTILKGIEDLMVS